MVVELEPLDAIAGFHAVVPFQLVAQRAGIIRKAFARAVGIGRHPMEGHLRDRKGQRFIEVHVLDEAIGVEEIVTFPAVRKRWQGRIAEFGIDILSAAKDDVTVVSPGEQRSDVAIPRVAAALPPERPGEADALIVIREVAGTAELDLLRVATEREMSRCEGELGTSRRGASVRTVIDEHLVPINLEVGLKTDAP